jgi:DNA-binding PadR family transcriptional regulator
LPSGKAGDIVDVDQSMATNRRQPKTLLALAILELLAEGPKHPYEMKQHIHQRGTDRAIPTKAASIYDTVERLTKAGFIVPVVSNREGRRPERTIYRLTGAGADELESWLRQLIEEPSHEYPRFGAALMFLGALRRKTEAIKALERRADAFEAEIASVDSMLRDLPPDLPRLFAIEDEYTQAMRRAELEWLRGTIAELKDGTLEWPQLIEQMERPMS